MLKHTRYFIYALIDPTRNNRIFYIGKAQEGKEASTMWRHLHGRNNGWKYNTIESIRQKGMQVEMKKLRVNLSEERALQLEMRLIGFLKWTGSRLTNLTKGGEGTTGYKHSQTICNQRSLRMKVNNPMKNPQSLMKSALARSKKVAQYIDGQLIAEFSSAAEAQRRTGVFQQNITACCRYETTQASGSVWRYL